MKMRVGIAVDRKEIREKIREKGLCVCECCERLLNCENVADGCENFELHLPLCNIDCADCYMRILEFCGGGQNGGN